MTLVEDQEVKSAGSGGGRGRGPGRGRGRGRGGRGGHGYHDNGRGAGAGGRGRGRGRGPGRGGPGRGRGGNGADSTTNTDTTSTATATVTSTNSDMNTNSNAHMPVCRFFQQNRCSFGSNCRFFHPPDTDTALAEENDTGTESGSCILTRSDSFKARSYSAFDANKAKAIAMAKKAQDMEPRNYESLEGPFYSMDIECVAIGYGHSKFHRYPCRVALVKEETESEGDGEGDIITLFDEYVNLENISVVSYMTALSGTSEHQCQGPVATKDLNGIRDVVKGLIPTNAVLVGHCIQHDIEWLGLKEGIDFREYFDTSVLFRQRVPKNLGSASNALKNNEQQQQQGTDTNIINSTSNGNGNGNKNTDEKDSVHGAPNAWERDDDSPDDSNLPFPTRYRTFSLRHCCLNILNEDIQGAAHDPVLDAKYSLLLFQKYKNAPVALLRAVRDSLHRSRPTASFASENPVVEGVCLSANGYRMKRAARCILAWWLRIKNSS